MIAPMVATMMDQMKPPWLKPSMLYITKPPKTAPTIPMRVVTIIPPGSSPGMISLPRAPAISPITIHAIMPILLPPSLAAFQRRGSPPAFFLRTPAAGPGAPSATYCPADERHQQGEDARASEDRAQSLRSVVGGTGEGHAAKGVQEAQAQEGSYTRQYYRDHQHQHGDQKAVLEPGSARETPRDVPADNEGQEQRDQEPDEAGRTALGGGGTGASSPQDCADYGTDDAAQDQASPERRQPAEDNAQPARAPLGVRVLVATPPALRSMLGTLFARFAVGPFVSLALRAYLSDRSRTVVASRLVHTAPLGVYVRP